MPPCGVVKKLAMECCEGILIFIPTKHGEFRTEASCQWQCVVPPFGPSFEVFCCASLNLLNIFLVCLFCSFLFLFTMAEMTSAKPSTLPHPFLVSPIFNKNHYRSWCRSMSIALSAKNKIQLVSGTTLN